MRKVIVCVFLVLIAYCPFLYVLDLTRVTDFLQPAVDIIIKDERNNKIVPLPRLAISTSYALSYDRYPLQKSEENGLFIVPTKADLFPMILGPRRQFTETSEISKSFRMPKKKILRYFFYKMNLFDCESSSIRFNFIPAQSPPEGVFNNPAQDGQVNPWEGSLDFWKSSRETKDLKDNMSFDQNYRTLDITINPLLSMSHQHIDIDVKTLKKIVIHIKDDLFLATSIPVLVPYLSYPDMGWNLGLHETTRSKIEFSPDGFSYIRFAPHSEITIPLTSFDGYYRSPWTNTARDGNRQVIRFAVNKEHLIKYIKPLWKGHVVIHEGITPPGMVASEDVGNAFSTNLTVNIDGENVFFPQLISIEKAKSVLNETPDDGAVSEFKVTKTTTTDMTIRTGNRFPEMRYLLLVMYYEDMSEQVSSTLTIIPFTVDAK